MNITEFLIYDFEHRNNSSKSNQVRNQSRTGRNGRSTAKTNTRAETTHLVTLGDGSENKSEKLK